MFVGSGPTSGQLYTGDIGHSLRLRKAASAYLNRAVGTPTAQNSWCWSGWVKLSELPNGANYRPLFAAGPAATGTWPGEGLFCYQDGTLAYYSSSSAGTHNITKRSSQVLRDPTSWYHIFVRKTAAANSGSSFVRIWVNNVEITSWTVNSYTGTQASVPDYINTSATNHTIGRFMGEYLDGYLARVAFVDNGGSLLPTDFGYFNTEINEWVTKTQVKVIVDAGGTNSFMLDFDDPNFATYNVGKDFSAKGNHWTPNNVSLTAGATYDWMLDVPGNSYCTANEIDEGANPGSTTPSEASMKSQCNAVSGGSSICGSVALPVGKWVWEYTPTAIGDGLILGITSRTSGAPSGTAVGYVFNGQKNIAGTSTAYGAAYVANDVIRVEVDTTANTIEFFKNGTSQGVITNATYVVPGCKPLHWNNSSSGSSTVQHNYGQAPLHVSAAWRSGAGGYFRDAPTTGFKALCQANLPDVPAALLNPEKHFDVVLYQGNGAASGRDISTETDPDLAWIKSRSMATGNHFLFDTVRGATKLLGSNQTAAEYTNSDMGLGAKKFTVGDNAGADDYNPNKNLSTYVAWLFKAGGAAVTNNAGSISSQVSANTDMGFSIVTYTGTGANATVGHGLGKAPKLVITKRLSGAWEWAVWHQGIAATEYLFLNATTAKATAASMWNSTAPTSSVFSIGSASQSGAAASFVAYCFADSDIIKCGSYTGNGSADGPFVHTGFRSKFLMIKRIDAAGFSWCIHDAVRDPYNPSDKLLYAESSGAEAAANYVDFDSSGFKIRNLGGGWNASGGTYIYIAIADVCGKYSLAR